MTVPGPPVEPPIDETGVVITYPVDAMTAGQKAAFETLLGGTLNPGEQVSVIEILKAIHDNL